MELQMALAWVFYLVQYLKPGLSCSHTPYGPAHIGIFQFGRVFSIVDPTDMSSRSLDMWRPLLLLVLLLVSKQRERSSRSLDMWCPLLLLIYLLVSKLRDDLLGDRKWFLTDGRWKLKASVCP